MFKTLTTVALVALTAASTATAAPLSPTHPQAKGSYPGAVESPLLEAKLPTAVRVFCTRNTNWSFALLQEREIYLDLNTCAALQNQPSQYSFGLAAYTLFHEWWHIAFQETDEQNTDLGALTVMRYLLRTYWGMTPAQAEANYLTVAGQIGLVAPARTPYHPLYLPTAVDPLEGR